MFQSSQKGQQKEIGKKFESLGEHSVFMEAARAINGFHIRIRASGLIGPCYDKYIISHTICDHSAQFLGFLDIMAIQCYPLECMYLIFIHD